MALDQFQKQNTAQQQGLLVSNISFVANVSHSESLHPLYRKLSVLFVCFFLCVPFLEVILPQAVVFPILFFINGIRIIIQAQFPHFTFICQSCVFSCLFLHLLFGEVLKCFGVCNFSPASFSFFFKSSLINLSCFVQL